MEEEGDQVDKRGKIAYKKAKELESRMSGLCMDHWTHNFKTMQKAMLRLEAKKKAQIEKKTRERRGKKIFH